MCFSCDYCETALPGGKLRMVPDADIGGAVQMMCHDCYHTHGDEPLCADFDDCEWLAFQTADEWTEERQAYCEAVAEAKAEARRARMQDEGLL